MKVFITLLILLVANLQLGQSQTKISNSSGTWNDPTIWTPNGVPASTDNVIITSNHRIDLTTNQSCNSLTVGTGGTAYLRFDSNTDRLFTVNGSIVVATSARFRVAGANGSHTVAVKGNITNNGTINFYRNSNRNAELVLNNNGNQTISGTGIESRFYNIRLNMGTSFNNIAEFSTTSFIVLSDFLKLQNGTFKYSKASAVNIIPFSSAITIPSTAGLWMNASTSVVDLPAGIIVSGKLSNSNGTINVGNATNETLLYSSGTFSFTGGVTNIAGRFNGNLAASTCVFNMSGGVINVPSVGSSNTTDAPFQIGTAGSQFNMSGGSLIIQREGGSGTQNLGYVNLAGSGTVNGGTVQIGSATSPANQIIKINSTALIPNLVLNNSTATASLLTNAMTVTNTIKITLGNLNSNNLGITLGGNWENNGGTFTPGTALVTFNSSSAQSIFKSGGETFNSLLFSGSGIKTFSSPVTASSNFSISTGSTVDVSASNHQLTVRGDFINSGTFNAQNGLVFLNGTTSQTIGGNSTTNFFNLTLTNSAGAILTQAENLIGTLTLTSGTLNTNSQAFTMISNAAGTARIAQITGTGNIIGNVTVQRFAPGGTTGWALIGTPISSALTLNDWDDDIAISCPTCPDGYVANFPSIYSYNEAATGTYSDPASYVALSTINDVIIPNRGYWVYLGDGFTTTNNITLDVTGTVRKQNQTIPLSRTNNASSADIGWNLIHNPYPSAISWTALRNGNTSVDNAIYVYNADLNGGAGANASFVNGVSSPAVGSGGIGDNIPMCQGFYVHVTAATNLTAQESNKVASNPTYLRSSSQNSINIVRLNMKKDNGYNDECVIYIQPGATTNFDAEYDAIKMTGQDPYAPTIQVEEGSTISQINAIAPVVGTYSTYIKTLTGYSGSYTISATEFNSFPVGTCFSLYDRFTSTSTDLTLNDYVFNLSDTTTVARFILNITLNPLSISANITQPTCAKINGGEVTAVGLSAGPWNYYWKDANNQIIKTTLNKATADTLNGLLNGAVNLDITTVGGCDNNQSNYFIIKKELPYADFLVADTCYMNQNAEIFCNNISANTVSQIWTFGDNIGTSTAYAPSYQYQTVGSYDLRLIANSPTGCVDTVVKTIFVSDRPVGLNETAFSNTSIKLKSLSNNEFVITGSLNESSVVSYEIIDAQGKIIGTDKKLNQKTINFDLNLDKYKAGVYFLNLMIDNSKTVFKLPVNH